MKGIYSADEVREQAEKIKTPSKKILKGYIEQINDEIIRVVALGEEVGLATFAKVHRDYMKKLLEDKGFEVEDWNDKSVHFTWGDRSQMPICLFNKSAIDKLAGLNEPQEFTFTCTSCNIHNGDENGTKLS